MPYDVKARKLSAQRTAVIRVSAPPDRVAAEIRAAIAEVATCLDRQRVGATGPPLARYFDFSEDGAELEAGFPVTEGFRAEGRVQASELLGGRAATTVHRGAFEDLQAAHDAIGDWVLARDHDPDGPVWEVYTVGPEQESDPAAWRTEVVWPLRK